MVFRSFDPAIQEQLVAPSLQLIEKVQHSSKKYSFLMFEKQIVDIIPWQTLKEAVCLFYTAKTKYRKLETNIPRKGISGPQSQFPHSCVCEQFIYSHDWSAYSAAGKYVHRS
jgi:hypothetical protein